jgi:hypothetical protein
LSALRFPIAVDFRRIALDNRWISERWEPFAVVFPPIEGGNAGPPVASALDTAGDQWRFLNCTFELHPSEAEGYYLNLTSPDPKVFVMWRMKPGEGTPPLAPVRITISYNEAARSMDGGEMVDTVPMPALLLELMRDFVERNYRQERKQKAQRNDPRSDGLFRRERAARR